jgi:hypothetical protein
MSRKNVLTTNIPVIKNQSMAASFNGPPTSITYLDNLMIQIVYTGTPTGTFAIQASNDYDPDISPATTNWITLPLSGTPTAAGSGDSIDIQMTGVGSPWIRLAYTASGGAGNLNMWINGKSL